MSDVYDNYSINKEVLESNVSTPHILVFLGSSLGSIVLNTFLMMFLINFLLGFKFNEISTVVAVALGTAIYVTGVIGGFVWEKMGKIIAKSFYVAYLPEVKNNWVSSLYRRFIDKDGKIFVEARSPDRQFKGPLGVGKLILRISISQLAFFITITTFVVTPLIPGLRDSIGFYNKYGDLINPFIALAISVVILAFYLPMSFLMGDSNLRTFDIDTRKIDTPGSTLRARLDSLAGIGALSSGWAIFEDVRANVSAFFTDDTGYFLFPGTSTIPFVLDYITWLIYIMVISWPIIFPAALFFFGRYQKTVNSFRTQALRDGIPLGVARVRPPQEEEKSAIDDYISVDEK